MRRRSVVPGAANADIVYFPNVDTVVNQTGSFDFNLTGPSSDDITLTADAGIRSDGSGDPTNEIVYSASTGAQVWLIRSCYGVATLPTLHSGGALIDPSAGNWGSGGKLVNYDTVTGAHDADWSLTGDTGYLGFYFGTPGSPQAGWVQISTTDGPGGASFGKCWTMPTRQTPNTPISAGQVPEPSAFPLLVLGGAGLVALRRRRAAHA